MNNLGDFFSGKIPYPLKARKKISTFLKKARANARPDTCILCDKKLDKPCNSHSVPRFVLKNISISGKLNTANASLKMPFLDEEKGINNFETFYTICRDCDSKFFTDYENPDNWVKEPTDSMLSQIALKNFLLLRSKRLKEIALYDLMNEAVEGGSTYFDLKQRVNTIDKEEYENSIKKLKSEVEKNKSFSYKEDLYILLPYKVPIAFQGPITMISGFDASLINNIYDLNPAHKMQELHVLIFPLENSSVILCFTNKNHHRYRSFFKNVKKLSQEDQLAIVQYIVLAYAESPAFSDTLDKKTFNIRSLKTVMGMESTIANSEPSSLSKTIFFAAKEYSCEKAFDLPNLLLPEYSI